MAVYSIIPARGGSKGIQKKNLQKIGAQTLLEITIKKSLSNKEINKTVVSTEDSDISYEAVKSGAMVLKRPDNLAEDNVHSVYVILDAIKQLKLKKSDIILMLLPTCPFRKAYRFSEAINMLNGFPSVIGVEDIGPLHSIRTKDNKNRLFKVDNSKKNPQRQEAKRAYRVNGALFASTVEMLELHNTFHIQGATPLLMDHIESIDIDTKEDLEWARRISLSESFM